MRGSFKLGKVAGIGVFVHWTFSLLLLFIIFSNYRAGHNLEQIIWSVVFILSIFATVFLHELGHALAAKRYNINTKDITLLPIGGLARLERIPEKPTEELVVALAGPAVNILLALFTYLAIQIPDVEQFPALMANGINAENFFLNFFIVNIWLSVFNLIPAFPMDGGRVLRALLSIKLPRHTATTIAARIGQVLALGFIILGFYTNPFLIFIGIFIMLGAQSEAEVTKAGFMLQGVLTRDVVMRNFESLRTNDTLQLAVQKLLNGQSKTFVVLSGTQPVGTLSRDEIIKGLSEKGVECAVEDVMNTNMLRLEAAEPIDKAYINIITNKAGLATVFENGMFIGVLDSENILELIMIKGAFQEK